MPTFDGGHCFLTILLPIDTDDVVVQDGLSYSHVQCVRALLATLPTAHQSPEILPTAPNSPFARCMRTHFARFMVLDDVVFNGRMPTDALVTALRKDLPTDPLPVDSLPGPYLFFTADFDAPQGTDAELRSWLRDVHMKMALELEPVFAHCFEYTARVNSADSFADYMIAHQIETTMPFNDYGLPALPSAVRSVGAGVAAAFAIGAGVWWLLGWSWLGLAVGLVTAIAAAVAAAYLIIMRAGQAPFARVEGTDLPSVLKALYLQRQVIPLVARWQGKTPADLHAEVGAFLRSAQIEDLDRPSQLPGTIAEVRP